MKTQNIVEIVGYLARDPLIRKISPEREIASLLVYTIEHWKGRDGSMHSKKEYHRIGVFVQNIVDFIKRELKAGDGVSVRGSLHTREWKGETNRTVTEIVLQTPFSLLLKIYLPNKSEKSDIDGIENNDSHSEVLDDGLSGDEVDDEDKVPY